ncbi:MAG: SEL1-like repeat protein, partial [Rhodospirillaceae bacterium]|nr:SEL1-like repeat protein [Rhodospirillaceae bacterium]
MMIFRVARGALLAGVLTIAAACGATGPEAERGSRADRVFIMAAEGDSTAQTALGLLYERGIGIARDPALALVWYRRAAEQG